MELFIVVMLIYGLEMSWWWLLPFFVVACLDSIADDYKIREIRRRL